MSPSRKLCCNITRPELHSVTLTSVKLWNLLVFLLKQTLKLTLLIPVQSQKQENKKFCVCLFFVLFSLLLRLNHCSGMFSSLRHPFSSLHLSSLLHHFILLTFLWRSCFTAGEHQTFLILQRHNKSLEIRSKWNIIVSKLSKWHVFNILDRNKKMQVKGSR